MLTFMLFFHPSPRALGSEGTAGKDHSHWPATQSMSEQSFPLPLLTFCFQAGKPSFNFETWNISKLSKCSDCPCFILRLFQSPSFHFNFAVSSLKWVKTAGKILHSCIIQSMEFTICCYLIAFTWDTVSERISRTDTARVCSFLDLAGLRGRSGTFQKVSK